MTAILTVSRMTVTCPACRHDKNSPSGAPDWSLEELLAVENDEEYSTCPMCAECGTFFTVILPEIIAIEYPE